MVGGGDFGAQQVDPAAVAEGVDGFAVHEGLNGLAAADGVLLGVVKKDGGVGVNRNHAGIRERVACHLAGVDGVALLTDGFGFARGAVETKEDRVVGHGGGEAVGLLVLPGFPEFPFGGKEIGVILSLDEPTSCGRERALRKLSPLETRPGSKSAMATSAGRGFIKLSFRTGATIVCDCSPWG